MNTHSKHKNNIKNDKQQNMKNTAYARDSYP